MSEVATLSAADSRPSLLRRIDRSPWLALVLALAFPFLTIRAGQLFSSAQLRQTVEWPLFRFGSFSSPIVGLAHGRPLEVCPSIDEEFASHVRLQEQQGRARGIGRLTAMLRDQHRASRAILMGKCAGGWVWKPGSSGHLYAQFARDAPVAWIFGRLGGSEILIGLFVLVSALAGTFGLGRLVRAVSGSNAVLAVALALFGWTAAELFRIFGRELLWALYGVLSCWLIATFNRESDRRSRLADAALIAALIVNLAGYLVVTYSAPLGPIALSVVAMALSLAARPSRDRAIRLATIVVGVSILIWDCSAFSKRQLAPLSSLNFALGGSFGEMALTTGFWTERPNPVSYPLGDTGVYAAYLAEPLIRERATWLYEYQGFQAFGKALFGATVWRYPMIAVEGVLKRLFLLVARLDVLSQPLAVQSPWFVRVSQVTAAFALALALSIAWLPSRWHLELPLVLIPLWNVFGIELMTHLVHTHSEYHRGGLMQLALLAPVLTLVAAREARARLPLRLPEGRPQSFALFAASGFAMAALGVVLYTAVQRELRVFDIWYQPWIGMYRTPLDRASLEPPTVHDKIEGLRALGESAPGSVSMYGVWTMARLAMYAWAPESTVGSRLNMTRDEIDARRKDATDRAAQYFRRAVAEAPDNPWIVTFAYMWDPDRVAELYERLLARHPDHPYAPWWAYSLTQRLHGERQLRYTRLLDELTHSQLVATETLRPGFAEAPAVKDAADVRERDEATEMKVIGEHAATIGSADAFGSDRLGLMVYIGVLSGSVVASLEVHTDDGVVQSSEQRLGPETVDRYRM